MAERKPQQTALEKMQDIANRLISNTPELSKILDEDSALKPKRPFSPNTTGNPKKNPGKSDYIKNNTPIYNPMNKG